MKRTRLVLLTSAGLVVSAAFTACGGLNSNRVNIIDTAAAGDDSGGTGGSSAGSAGKPSAGSHAGGSSGDNGAAGDNTTDAGAAGMTPITMPGEAPTVVSVTPADETPNFEPASPIVLHFSEPLDPATVTTTTIVVKTSSGAVVPGTVSYKDAVATFTPNTHFDLLETYTVNVSTGVRDLDSTPLKAPFTSLFVVRDGAFGTEAELSGADATTLDNAGAQFACAGSHAIVVWSQKTGANTTFDVIAKMYNEATGWSDPTVVNIVKVDSKLPAVAMNDKGDAIVAWAQADANIGQAIVARRLLGGVWDDAAPAIDHAVSNMAVHSITAGISPLSTTHVIWTALSAPSTFYTLAQHRTLAGTWAPEPATMQTGTVQMGPAVMGFDATDNGFALYAPLDTGKVYAERYLSAGTWGVNPINGSDADSVDNISLALDGADGAMAIWSRNTGNDSEVVASNYAHLWSSPVPITGADKNGIYDTSIAHAGKGFIAAWTQIDSVLNVKTSEFGTAWSSPVVRSSGNHAAEQASVAADAHGNALLLWSELSGGIASSADIWFSRLVNTGDKWSAPALVEMTAGNFEAPHVGVLADGTALAEWQFTTNSGISGKFVKGYFGNLWR